MMKTIDVIKHTTDNWVSEIKIDIKYESLCRKARLDKRREIRDIYDPAKQSIKDCNEFRISNPKRFMSCRAYHINIIKKSMRRIETLRKEIKKYCYYDI